MYEEGRVQDGLNLYCKVEYTAEYQLKVYLSIYIVYMFYTIQVCVPNSLYMSALSKLRNRSDISAVRYTNLNGNVAEARETALNPPY